MALLSDAGIAGGLIFLACLLSFACLLVLAFQDGRQHAPAGCPWCDTHECIDRTRCNCAGPCGSWLCVVKEADHG